MRVPFWEGISVVIQGVGEGRPAAAILLAPDQLFQPKDSTAHTITTTVATRSAIYFCSVVCVQTDTSYPLTTLFSNARQIQT